ncbi:hypothetical protein MOQ_009271 [Trypanosoma cruzi marinkellei]|uniref:Uncharacterized protein n=1 Tax=Trypanosoma cruzi marinkellei TaxID=85056 RepID=K2NDA1_TRYCR|nr:hypothetical protein MOQ_009271 [Trypanosoma cruzi marinkellei]
MAVATSPLLGDDNDADCTFSDQFALIARRMSRALLHHPKLALFCDYPHVMYEALHNFFAHWSARQQRASSLSLTMEQTINLLRYGESTIRSTGLLKDTLTQAQTAAEFVAVSPLIAIESLSHELRSVQVSVGMIPLAEIVELARVLDNVQGLVTPFGSLNLVHLVALGATLCLAPDMKTLLLMVSTCLHHRLLCAAVFYEWSLIDKPNANALRELSKKVEKEASDDGIKEVVNSMLGTTFEGFGNKPTDPLITDATIEIIAPSEDCIASSTSGPRPQKSEETLPTAPQEGASDDCNFFEEDVALTDRGDSRVADTVDVEFWRRLCS